MSHLPHALAAELLSEGRLRVAINLGNPMLAHLPAGATQPAGVSVDIATEFARRLSLPLDLIRFEAAGRAAEALADGQVQLAFLARDPERAQTLRFSAPYLEIEGAYLVRDTSPLRSMDEVDRPGQRVVVGRGSAYDLYLGRTLRHAQIVRAATSPTVTDEFVAQQLEVAAGVRQQLEADIRRHGGLRLLPGRFMVIEQAMAISRRKSAGTLALLAAFVEQIKHTGFVSRALLRHQIEGATVAPPADQLQGAMS